MSLNASSLQIGAAAIAADIDHATLHSSLPDGTGSNQTTAGVQAVTVTATTGVLSLGSTAFTGGAASGAVTYLGLWHGTPGSGGVWRGYLPLTVVSGGNAFNASGQYTLDAMTLTGSAT